MAKGKLHIITGTLALLALAGCSADWDMPNRMDPNDYYAAHPIRNRVEGRTQSYLVKFQKDGQLPHSEVQKLEDELHAISPMSIESILVKTSPASVHNEQRHVYVTKLLRDLGFDKSDISFEPADVLKNGEAEIIISYNVVVSPDCPDWRRSPVTDYSNSGQGNF